MGKLTRVQASLEVPWEDRPTVVHLTHQILRLQALTAARVVESVIAIGEATQEIHDELPHGQWARWCAEAVPFARQTLSNYMALARWAEERPKEVEKLAYLGPSKLYLLLPLPPGVRRRLVGRKPIQVPDGPLKTVERMTVSELARVTAQEVRVLPEHRPMPVGRVVGRVRRSIAGLDASAQALVERAEDVEPDDARVLHDALLEVAESLRATFELK
ncbi:MAG: DUF3102 domain-containing protein [Nannocystaceae bacterium]|nr:DUF3102 domain-containing protein [Nannocystaceae bacterium]